MSGGAASRARALRPSDPRVLGPYEILGRLGEGGMGRVYLAEAPDGTPVALKVIRAELADDPEFRRRFRGEVNRARQVPPFCTAEVLDADTEHDPPYLVVEYVDGPSLGAVVEDRGPLTPANQHGLAVGVAVALTAIHGAGVIHRDLKPSNVLLAPGSPKVIDFGIARAIDATNAETQTGQAVGTVAYMAPERFGSDASTAITAAADIFAWGAVVAYAGLGRTPFGADIAAALAVRIMTAEPDLQGLRRPLRDLVEHALAKNPANRPTARELVDRLLAVGPGAPARPAAFAEQPEVLAAAGISPRATAVVAGPPPRTAPAEVSGPPAATEVRPAGAGPWRQPTEVLPAGASPWPPPAEVRPPGAGGPPPAPGHWPHATAVQPAGVGAWPPDTDYRSPGGGGTPPPTEVRPPTDAGDWPPHGGNPPRGPNRRGSRIALVALTVSVLLLAGAVVGIVTGRLPLPRAGGPGETSTSSPGANQSSTPGVSPSAGPTPSVAAGARLVLSDPLTSPRDWQVIENAERKATCAFDNAYVVTSEIASSFRCRGNQTSWRDFSVFVDVKLINEGSCAAVWFRFASERGYALRICRDGYFLVTHGTPEPSMVTLLREFRFPDAPIATGVATRVGITAEGSSLRFYRDGDIVGGWVDSTFAAGRIIPGVFQSIDSAPAAPFQVSFAKLEIWSPDGF